MMTMTSIHQLTNIKAAGKTAMTFGFISGWDMPYADPRHPAHDGIPAHF